MAGGHLFRILVVATATSGLMLSEGVVHGWMALIVAGAVMSAVCPWGVAAAWLVVRLRSRLRSGG